MKARVIVYGRDAYIRGRTLQTTKGRRWAEEQGYAVVESVSDHQSGSTDPYTHPNLGPWLTEPERMGQYVAIVATSPDRLTRSADQLEQLQQWAKDHGKRIITVSTD